MDDPDPPKAASKPASNPVSAKEAKLAAALRDNLRRRKKGAAPPPGRD